MEDIDKCPLKYAMAQFNMANQYYAVRRKLGIKKFDELLGISLRRLCSAGLERRTARLLLKSLRRRQTSILPNGVFAVDNENLSYGKIIGKGRFGIVFEGTVNRTSIAVKSLRAKVAKLGRGMFLSLDHPNLVHYIGLTVGDPFLIITEFIDSVSLRFYLDGLVSLPLVDTLINFCVQICDGMLFLHLNEIVHGSLCSQQILVDRRQVLKISDYNMPVLEDSTSRPEWSAPELLESHVPSYSSDVWAYAVTVWEIFAHKKLPWSGLSPQELIAAHQRGTLPRNRPCPVSLEMLLKRIWMSNKKTRPSFFNLRLYLDEIKLKTVQVVVRVNGRAGVVLGDYITVVDGRDSELWVGQNRRSLEIVEFSVQWVKSVPVLPSEAVRVGGIIPGSVQHLGHREPDGTGWGTSLNVPPVNKKTTSPKSYDYSYDDIISYNDSADDLLSFDYLDLS